MLTVYSVRTEEEARQLLTLACPINMKGEFVARELAREQTLENLAAFSIRLDEAHDMLVKTGGCECQNGV